jgi:hypothetical protein
MPTLLIALVSALLGQAAPEPAVQVETLDDGGWRLTLTVEGSQDPALAQARLLPKAAALCAGRHPRFGRYTFNASGRAPGEAGPPADRVTLVQTLTCADTPETTAPPAAAKPIVLDEAGATALQPRLLDLSNRYFDAIEQGRDEDAYRLILPEMTGDASLAEWSQRLARKRSEQGASKSRTLVKLTWYPDPPNSPRPGLYVAIDYVASWALQDECGYLVWYSPTVDGPFLLARQEQTSIPHDLDAATLAAIRQQHCILL